MPIPATFRQLATFALLTVLAHTPLAHSALIGLQPGSTTAGTGESVSLDLIVSGLGNFGPDSLGAFDISIGFDPAVLSFSSYSLGGFLGDLGLAEALDTSAGISVGTLNLSEVSLLSIASLDALQPGSFSLGTLNFDVLSLQAGQATQLSILSDPLLASASGSRLQVTGTSGAAVDGRVPVPGTALLLISALLGWRFSGHRRFN